MIYIPNKLIMIHIPRTGGTTFGRRILGQLFKIPINVEYRHIKYISNFIPTKKGVEIYGYNYRFERKSKYSKQLWKHSTGLEILNHLGKEEWDRCYKIAISKRNIYDRLASYYFHKIKINKISKNRYKEIEGISFKEYILNEIFDSSDNIMNYISDKQGNIIVDKIIDFRDINNELQMFSKFFFNKEMSFPKQNNNHSKTDYKSLYDNNMINKVKFVFKDEIDFFGWEI